MKKQVTLVAIPTQKATSILRGRILAQGNNTESCKRFGNSYGHPHRSYYYNVAYDVIAFACSEWKTKRIAMSHSSGHKKFDEDMTTCQAEALAYFCDSNPRVVPESFIFVSNSITSDDLNGIKKTQFRSRVHEAH